MYDAILFATLNFNTSHTFRCAHTNISISKDLSVMLFRFFLFSLLMAVAAARLGGWSTADPTAAELVQAISFALHTRFPNLNLVELGASAYKVIDAKKQVCLLNDILLPYFFV